MFLKIIKYFFVQYTLGTRIQPNFHYSLGKNLSDHYI